jgi:hypothetical protein
MVRLTLDPTRTAANIHAKMGEDLTMRVVHGLPSSRH